MQAIVVYVSGIIALLSYYYTTSGGYQILLVIQAFIILLGAFILYMSLAQANKRALLTVLEKRFNILVSGDINRPLFANYAIFFGELSGDPEYPYLAPLHEYTKRSLISIGIIGAIIYLSLVYYLGTNFWKSLNQDFMIGFLAFHSKIILTLIIFLILYLIHVSPIYFYLKSLDEITKGTTSEIKRLSKISIANKM